ncbi:hypothetical protein C5Y96_16125 [Blastopirellula marina]|uniref:Glycosyltransferase RgtA/B/C/D-like domain-containing protein n=1 Tax=Blastopirellula marina TaxID=124 RepID=A0A2S8F8C7_9BACT|nr:MULTISPECIES: glycosyltransferase family 39 protein [Pirellulaceae]PQO28413.1 hypothetical protein C5Y96_16125 [Blastopirellula marina]RCS49119.1 phospholipid carrier-dependent glycosyltransferase [Bremerella cremea]
MVCHRAILASLLLIHVTLVAWLCYYNAPVFHEVPHLSAGIHHWRTLRFDLYRVNPPLPRMLAAIPVLVTQSPSLESYEKKIHPWSRQEIAFGVEFIRSNREDFLNLYRLGRYAMLPFSILGCLLCYLWGRDLYGEQPGLGACALWCFSPTVIGHGALIMPDVPAAACGMLAAYIFWRWSKSGTWGLAFMAGAAIGLAVLCKTTMLVFLFICPTMWLYYTVYVRRSFAVTGILQLAAMLLVVIWGINSCYAFDGVLCDIESYGFKSDRFNVLASMIDGSAFANAPDRSITAYLPVPFPSDFIYGIDLQAFDFEQGARSYMRGSWHDRGWWYYYCYCAMVKMPHGTQLLLGLAGLSVGVRMTRGITADELFLLMPALVVFIVVSSQSGFSHHFRYVLPALPFLFVWGSRALVDCNLVWMKRLAISCVVATSLSSLFTVPHSLSYFNEFSGGPLNGSFHLLNSNTAWGQDILLLKEWVDSNPEASDQLHIACFGWVEPSLMGIKGELPPLGPSATATGNLSSWLGPKPGWHVVDVNFVQGSRFPVSCGTPGWTYLKHTDPHCDFTYFQHFTPVDYIGYSMNVYFITPDDANRVRQLYSLPRLKEVNAN